MTSQLIHSQHKHRGSETVLKVKSSERILDEIESLSMESEKFHGFWRKTCDLTLWSRFYRTENMSCETEIINTRGRQHETVFTCSYRKTDKRRAYLLITLELLWKLWVTHILVSAQVFARISATFCQPTPIEFFCFQVVTIETSTKDSWSPQFF